MKAKRAVLTIEVETDAPIRILRKASNLHITVTGLLYDVKVIQAQANRIKVLQDARQRC
jgi:hypothetical protein